MKQVLKFNIDMSGSELETLEEDIINIEQMIKKSWVALIKYQY